MPMKKRDGCEGDGCEVVSGVEHASQRLAPTENPQGHLPSLALKGGGKPGTALHSSTRAAKPATLRTRQEEVTEEPFGG